MENKTRKNVRQWRKVGVKRSLTSVFLCLLCAAMLVSSMSMALPVYAQEAPCTQEEHIHGEGCYVQVTSQTLERMICTVDADAIVHQHTDFCYDEAGNLRCTLEEKEAHTHGEDCLDAEQNLICQKEVLELHKHEADCYDTEGVLVCERAQVVEHVHTEGCFVAETVPVDTEGLTCTVTDETHEHTALCYGTWVLDCALPEHAHTEACGITAVPSQTSETSTETTEAATETTEVTETTTETAGATTPAERSQEPPAMALANGPIAELNGDNADIVSLGLEIKEGKEQMKTGTGPFDTTDTDESGNIIAGNDAGDDNNILRTFDTVTYTLAFTTQLKDNQSQDSVQYLTARVHFEFILPVSSKEAVFATDGMGWLFTDTNEDSTYFEIVEENGIQVLRGSFMMRPTEHAQTAIPGSQTLNIVIRALRMKNGDTLQPTFTMWLAHNQVVGDNGWVAGKENLIHNCFVSDDFRNDQEEDRKCQDHGKKEYMTFKPEPIIISAEPRYNVSLVENPSASATGRSDYNFGEGGANAPHKMADEYTLDGRMYGIGITVEMREGFTDQGESVGLRGIAFPDETKPITIGIKLQSKVKPETENDFSILPNEYQPWVWSVGGNYYGIHESEKDFTRNPHTTGDYSYNNPLNHLMDNSEASRRGNCYNGGTWSYQISPTQAPVGTIMNGGSEELVYGEQLTITIEGFKVNFEQMPNGITATVGNVYYNPKVVKSNYWLIPEAVFSSGELWVLLPYDSHGATPGTSLIDRYPQGTTKLEAEITDVKIYYESNETLSDEDLYNCNVIATEENDKRNYSDDYTKRGDVDTIIRYVVASDSYDPYANPYSANAYNPYSSLIPGCDRNHLDWAMCGADDGTGTVFGQRISMVTQVTANGAEKLNRYVGLDVLMKFDDRFFYPDYVEYCDDPSSYLFNRMINSKIEQEQGKGLGTILWAAKPDGTGWDHNGLNPDEAGYDLEMMKATQEDLIYFASLEELRSQKRDDGSSYVCVGVLAQKRDIFGELGNQLMLGVTGRVQPDAQPGYVYMIAYSSRAWSLTDILDHDPEYFGAAKGAVPTDAQFEQYARDRLPDWSTQTIAKVSGGQIIEGIDYDSYAKASYIEAWDQASRPDGIEPDEYDEIANNGQNGHQTSKKASYMGENGFDPGSGAPYYIDSCLLQTYVTGITKNTAQTYTVNGVTSAKSEYDLSKGQKLVIYELTPSAQRIRTGVGGEGSPLETTVTIVDKIPEGMSVVLGSVYWAGQDRSAFKNPETGEIREMTVDQSTGAVQYGLGVGEEDGNGASMSAVYNKETRELTITLHDVTVGGGDTTEFGNIYYSCQIDDDVKNQTELDNEVTICSTHDQREKTDVNENRATCRIEVLRTSAMSFTKRCETPVAQWWDELKFTMNSANTSDVSLTDVIIMDTLPFNGQNDGTNFHGRLVVSCFSADLQGANELPEECVKFYYTTDRAYVGKKAANLEANAWLGANWEELTPNGQNSEGQTVYTLPTVEEQQAWGMYDNTEIPKQITAIVAVGYIPKNSSLNMCAVLQLPDGQAGDVLNNFLSQNEHERVHAMTTVISRELSGLVWHDANRNGIQDDGEALWPGVQVALLQKNEQGVYEPFCYAGTTDAVIIKTGQKVSVQKKGSVEAHEVGEYLFMDLPAGDYAVCFNTGDKQYILEKYQLTQQDKGDEAVDSDAKYDEDFNGYLIFEIEMIDTDAIASEMKVNYVSEHHDAGFCDPYELPLTGGMGTTIYYILGAILTLPALVGLRRRKKR